MRAERAGMPFWVGSLLLRFGSELRRRADGDVRNPSERPRVRMPFWVAEVHLRFGSELRRRADGDVRNPKERTGTSATQKNGQGCPRPIGAIQLEGNRCGRRRVAFPVRGDRGKRRASGFRRCSPSREPHREYLMRSGQSATSSATPHGMTARSSTAARRSGPRRLRRSTPSTTCSPDAAPEPRTLQRVG